MTDPLPPPPPAGGIGIGLPFTGPSGVPVFGLTPEQRLARPAAKKKRWPIRVAIAAIAIVVGIIIAVATVPKGSAGPEPGTPTAEAAEAVDHDPAKAVAILEANKAAIGNDPVAQRVLGHAHATLRKNLPAALDSIPARAPALADARGRHRAAAAICARSPASARMSISIAHAFALWAGMTADPEAKAALLKAAISEDIHRRQAVRPVIEQLKLGEQVNWLVAYSYDLAQDEPCEKRAAAVARLRALGDAGAIAALQRAMIRHGKTGTKKGPNACLLDDAASAISYLKSLHK